MSPGLFSLSIKPPQPPFTYQQPSLHTALLSYQVGAGWSFYKASHISNALGHLEIVLVLYCCTRNYPQTIGDNTIVNIYYPHNICGSGIQVCLRWAALTCGSLLRLEPPCWLGLPSPGETASKMAPSDGCQVGTIIGGGLTFSPRGPLRLFGCLHSKAADVPQGE